MRADVPVSTRKTFRRAALTCLVLLVFYFVVPVSAASSRPAFIIRVIVSVVLFAALVLAINFLLVRQVHQPDAPIIGLLAAVVSGVLFFALLDYIVAIHKPDQFVELSTRLDALYFSLSTLATIGFGDVHAEGQFARGILCVQIVFDVAVLATGASVLARQIGARIRSRSGR
jgi:voltage-gated potassium channel